MAVRNGKRLGNHDRRRRSLLVEPLEQRDLLAADLFGPQVAFGPPDGAGLSNVVDCAPSGTQGAAQQQRSAAGDRATMAGGRGATLVAMARTAAQLRGRSGVTTTGDCQVGDRLVSRDRDRLADLDTRPTPLAGHNGNGQAGRNGSDNPGSGPVDGQVGQRPIVPVVTGDLADDQIQGLEQMREEEKLAHDVYLQLGEQWNAAIFAQIAQSESQHMAAVGSVLDRYGLDDPIDGYEIGEFPTPAVQDLYDSLVARGRTSLEDAYQVGATIEDMDIYDLQELLDSSNLPSDVARVYENLERGSRNHLRAFVGQIEAAGETYVAQFLDADQINEIVSTPIETGGAGRDGGRVDRPNRQRNASGPSPAQDRHDTPRWPILD